MAISGLDFYNVLGDQAPSPTGYQEREIMGEGQFSAPISPEAAADPRNLIVQGGPTIPEGQISVNGQLEPSQAAPQPLPWWIRAYDEYKAQRQAEDDAYRMLQRIQSDMPAGAGANSGQKAMELQAKMMYDADIRRGVPPHEALAKHGVGMWGRTAPNAAQKAAGLGRPQTIPPGEQQRLTLAREQFEESKKVHKFNQEQAGKKLTSSEASAKEKSKQQAIIKLGEQSSKRKEDDPRMQKRDPALWKKLTDREEAGAAILEQIAGIGAAPVATAAAPAPAPAPSAGIRFRDKKSGKTGIWRGPVASLTADKFEILK